MKKPNYNSNIFCVCIVAILCYTFLNGHQIALEMQEKEQFESLSKVVGGISRLTGGEFLSRQLAATVAHIVNYDTTVAENMAVQVAEEPQNPPALASNMPETTPATQENSASGQADSPAKPAVHATHTAQPATAEPAAAPTAQNSPQPAATTDAKTAPATDAKHAAAPPPPAPNAHAGTTPNKSVEEPAKDSSDKGMAESRDNKKRQSAAGKSIFAKPLSHRYKVLLVGDSFMEDITLAIMRNYYNNDPNVQFVSVARHSTGLCVSTNWNWPKKLEEFMQKHKPDVVLYFLGTNDMQSIYDGERRYSFTSAEWKKKYVELAENMIDIARRGNAAPIWIGLPVMSEAYAKWVPLIAELQQKACANRNTDYVDTVPTLADENGQYQVFMKTPQGEMVRIRKQDKYHIEYAGNLMILDLVVPRIKKCILEKEKVYEFALPAGSPQASR